MSDNQEKCRIDCMYCALKNEERAALEVIKSHASSIAKTLEKLPNSAEKMFAQKSIVELQLWAGSAFVAVAKNKEG